MCISIFMYFHRGYHQLKYSQYFIQDLPSSNTMADWKSHLRLEIFQLLEYLEDRPRTRKWLITMVIVSPLSRVVPLPNGLVLAYKFA